MGHEQGGERELRQQLGELITDPAASDRVERPERLVEQQDLRIAGERAGERRALALTAGQPGGPRVRQICDPDSLEQIRTVAPGGEAHVARDGQMREQAIVLGQIADASVLGADVNAALSVKPGPRAKCDPPNARSLQAGDRPEQRRLAGAGRSDQGDRLRSDGQPRAKLESATREDDVDVKGLHEWTSSFDASRMAAATIMSSTPIATAWSRFASNSE